MRALKFYQTGSLDDLRFEEVSLPTPGPGEVLIQVKAAAINPSDIKNVQGKMHETTVPRIPGRDFAGTIVKGPDELLGQSVFGSGGNSRGCLGWIRSNSVSRRPLKFCANSHPALSPARSLRRLLETFRL